MKDPIKAIKTAYQTLLNGAVDFSGSPIPCFIGEGNITSNNSYMVISAAKADLIPNKGMFAYSASITIDIISKQKVLLSDPFNPVDVITEGVMQLVLPSITTTGLSINADFQLNSTALDTTNYSVVEDYQANRLMRRQVTFIHNIIEK